MPVTKDEGVQFLSRLQRQLERTYELAIPHEVADFVITHDEGIDYSSGDVAVQAPEKVVIVEHEDSDYIDLGLYLDQAVLDALVGDDPTRHLHDGNLEI